MIKTIVIKYKQKYYKSIIDKFLIIIIKYKQKYYNRQIQKLSLTKPDLILGPCLVRGRKDFVIL